MTKSLFETANGILEKSQAMPIKQIADALIAHFTELRQQETDDRIKKAIDDLLQKLSHAKTPLELYWAFYNSDHVGNLMKRR